MDSWKNKLSFLCPQGVSVPIKGTDVKFFAFPVNVAFKLRDMKKPLAEAFVHLSGAKKGDVDYEENTIQTPDGAFQRKISTNAVDPSVLKMRDDKKIKAIEDVVDMVFDNQALLRDCICSSMREIFPEPKEYPSPAELFEYLGMDALPDIFKGLVEANRKILGPFSDLFIQMMNNKMDQLKDNLKKTVEEDLQEEGQEGSQKPGKDLKKV